MVNLRRSIQRLLSILIPVLLIVCFLPQTKTTFASTTKTESFTIEAGQIQGVMLPPKIVFVNTDSAHPTPAVEFRYQEATITGMTLYKQLETESGPMLVKIQANEPIHVTNLAVTATSFSFTGACLDFSKPKQALVLKNVMMQATEMTTDTMTSNGLTLTTKKGSLPIQNQALPGFLQGIMNENSFSAEKQKASEVETTKGLLMCPASDQEESSTSTKKTGVLPTGSNPVKVIKQVGGTATAPITQLLPSPSGLATKTEPILKPIKKVGQVVEKATGTTGTVGQVVKTAKDASTAVTTTVGQVVKTAKDTSTTVTKTVGQVAKTTTDTSKVITKTAEQLKLENEIKQLQSDLDTAQKATNQLTNQIKTLSETIENDQTTLNDIGNILSNPFNFGKIADELLALGDLNSQLSKTQTHLDQVKDQENKEQQTYLDIKKRAQDLGSAINTDNLKTSLDKNQAHLSSLTQQLSSLKEDVQSLLGQFS